MKKCFEKIVMALTMLMFSVSAIAQVSFDVSDGRYAKFISDRSIGVSLYEKGRYCDALPYLESAHSFCTVDSVLNEYLYFTYKNTLRDLDANKLFSSIPAASVSAYGLKRCKPISSIYVEGGALFADNKSSWDDSYIYFERYMVGNGGFASLDFVNEIGGICELSHHLGFTSRTNPVEMKGSNSTYFNLRSKYVGLEYEVNAKFNINERWKVTPFMRVGHESYDVVGFSLDTTIRAAAAREPSDWENLLWDDKQGSYPVPEKEHRPNDGWNEGYYPAWDNQWGAYNNGWWPNMYNPYGYNGAWGNWGGYPGYDPEFWQQVTQSPYRYTHSSYRHSRSDVLVGCRASYSYGRHWANAGFSFFHGEGLNVLQGDLSYRYYPFGNVNLYLSPRISYIWRGNDRGKIGDLPGSLLAEIEAGGKIFKRLWGNAAFLYGNICDYHDRDSHTFYSLSCETNLRCSAQLIYLLNNHLNIILTYKYTRKKSNLFLVDTEGNSSLKPFGQNDNVIAGGVQWNF